jgi:hypothetical protein
MFRPAGAAPPDSRILSNCGTGLPSGVSLRYSALIGEESARRLSARSCREVPALALPHESSEVIDGMRDEWDT